MALINSITPKNMAKNKIPNDLLNKKITYINKNDKFTNNKLIIDVI